MVRLCATDISVEEILHFVYSARARVCLFHVILRKNDDHFPELIYFVMCFL